MALMQGIRLGPYEVRRAFGESRAPGVRQLAVARKP